MSGAPCYVEGKNQLVMVKDLPPNISETSTIVWIHSIKFLTAGMFHCIRSVSLQVYTNSAKGEPE